MLISSLYKREDGRDFKKDSRGDSRHSAEPYTDTMIRVPTVFLMKPN